MLLPSGETVQATQAKRFCRRVLATSDNHATASRLLDSAARELGAFIGGVSESLGPEHAGRAADCWLDELERIEVLHETQRDFRAITIAAAVRLATCLGTGSAQLEKHAYGQRLENL